MQPSLLTKHKKLLVIYLFVFLTNISARLIFFSDSGVTKKVALSRNKSVVNNKLFSSHEKDVTGWSPF